MQHLYQDQKGFSLLEVMAASIILAVAILGLTAAFSQGRQVIETSKLATLATKLAQQQMDTIRNDLANGASLATVRTTYNNLSTSYPTAFPNFTFSGQVVAEYVTFNTSGALIPSGSPTEMLNVTVTVQWPESVYTKTLSGGQVVVVNRQVKLNSVLAK